MPSLTTTTLDEEKEPMQGSLSTNIPDLIMRNAVASNYSDTSLPSVDNLSLIFPCPKLETSGEIVNTVDKHNLVITSKPLESSSAVITSSDDIKSKSGNSINVNKVIRSSLSPHRTTKVDQSLHNLPSLVEQTEANILRVAEPLDCVEGVRVCCYTRKHHSVILMSALNASNISQHAIPECVYGTIRCIDIAVDSPSEKNHDQVARASVFAIVDWDRTSFSYFLKPMVFPNQLCILGGKKTTDIETAVGDKKNENFIMTNLSSSPLSTDADIEKIHSQLNDKLIYLANSLHPYPSSYYSYSATGNDDLEGKPRATPLRQWTDTCRPDYHSEEKRQNQEQKEQCENSNDKRQTQTQALMTSSPPHLTLSFSAIDETSLLAPIDIFRSLLPLSFFRDCVSFTNERIQQFAPKALRDVRLDETDLLGYIGFSLLVHAEGGHPLQWFGLQVLPSRRSCLNVSDRYGFLKIVYDLISVFFSSSPRYPKVGSIGGAWDANKALLKHDPGSELLTTLAILQSTLAWSFYGVNQRENIKNIAKESIPSASSAANAIKAYVEVASQKSQVGALSLSDFQTMLGYQLMSYFQKHSKTHRDLQFSLSQLDEQDNKARIENEMTDGQNTNAIEILCPLRKCVDYKSCICVKACSTQQNLLDLKNYLPSSALYNDSLNPSYFVLSPDQSGFIPNLGSSSLYLHKHQNLSTQTSISPLKDTSDPSSVLTALKEIVSSQSSIYNSPILFNLERNQGRREAETLVLQHILRNNTKKSSLKFPILDTSILPSSSLPFFPSYNIDPAQMVLPTLPSSKTNELDVSINPLNALNNLNFITENPSQTPASRSISSRVTSEAGRLPILPQATVCPSYHSSTYPYPSSVTPSGTIVPAFSGSILEVDKKSPSQFSDDSTLHKIPKLSTVDDNNVRISSPVETIASPSVTRSLNDEMDVNKNTYVTRHRNQLNSLRVSSEPGIELSFRKSQRSRNNHENRNGPGLGLRRRALSDVEELNTTLSQEYGEIDLEDENEHLSKVLEFQLSSQIDDEKYLYSIDMENPIRDSAVNLSRGLISRVSPVVELATTKSDEMTMPTTQTKNQNHFETEKLSQNGNTVSSFVGDSSVDLSRDKSTTVGDVMSTDALEDREYQVKRRKVEDVPILETAPSTISCDASVADSVSSDPFFQAETSLRVQHCLQVQKLLDFMGKNQHNPEIVVATGRIVYEMLQKHRQELIQQKLLHKKHRLGSSSLKPVQTVPFASGVDDGEKSKIEEQIEALSRSTQSLLHLPQTSGSNYAGYGFPLPGVNDVGTTTSLSSSNLLTDSLFQQKQAVQYQYQQLQLQTMQINELRAAIQNQAQNGAITNDRGISTLEELKYAVNTSTLPNSQYTSLPLNYGFGGMNTSTHLNGNLNTSTNLLGANTWGFTGNLSLPMLDSSNLIGSTAGTAGGKGHFQSSISVINGPTISGTNTNSVNHMVTTENSYPSLNTPSGNNSGMESGMDILSSVDPRNGVNSGMGSTMNVLTNGNVTNGTSGVKDLLNASTKSIAPTTSTAPLFSAPEHQPQQRTSTLNVNQNTMSSLDSTPASSILNPSATPATTSTGITNSTTFGGQNQNHESSHLSNIPLTHTIQAISRHPSHVNSSTRPSRPKCHDCRLFHDVDRPGGYYCLECTDLPKRKSKMYGLCLQCKEKHVATVTMTLRGELLCSKYVNYVNGISNHSSHMIQQYAPTNPTYNSSYQNSSGNSVQGMKSTNSVNAVAAAAAVMATTATHIPNNGTNNGITNNTINNTNGEGNIDPSATTKFTPQFRKHLTDGSNPLTAASSKNAGNIHRRKPKSSLRFSDGTEGLSGPDENGIGNIFGSVVPSHLSNDGYNLSNHGYSIRNTALPLANSSNGNAIGTTNSSVSELTKTNSNVLSMSASNQQSLAAGSSVDMTNLIGQITSNTSHTNTSITGMNQNHGGISHLPLGVSTKNYDNSSHNTGSGSNLVTTTMGSLHNINSFGLGSNLNYPNVMSIHNGSPGLNTSSSQMGLNSTYISGSSSLNSAAFRTQLGLTSNLTNNLLNPMACLNPMSSFNTMSHMGSSHSFGNLAHMNSASLHGLVLGTTGSLGGLQRTTSPLESTSTYNTRPSSFVSVTTVGGAAGGVTPGSGYPDASSR